MRFLLVLIIFITLPVSAKVASHDDNVACWKKYKATHAVITDADKCDVNKDEILRILGNKKVICCKNVQKRNMVPPVSVEVEEEIDYTSGGEGPSSQGGGSSDNSDYCSAIDAMHGHYDLSGSLKEAVEDVEKACN